MSAGTMPLDINQWNQWDQKSKDKFLDGLRAENDDKIVWYCKVGRSCDGEAHPGAPYPHARGDQWPPPGSDWVYWVLKGGRGSGKTRSGAEWCVRMSDKVAIGSIIGPTTGHVREFMIEGEPSGLIASFRRRGIKALWEPTKHRISLPNGHIIRTFSGEEPERLRGPEHGYVWLDEPAHIALIDAVWKQMKLGLRFGPRPVVLCTTTPLPIEWMIKLLKHKRTRAITVSTYANLKNLAPAFAEEILADFEGTRLGRQELHGEILEDVEGALWNTDLIDNNRAEGEYTIEQMDRVVVGIDPAGTSSKKRDETGIIVVGKRGNDYYVFADKSGHYTPNGWAKAGWKAYDDFQADKIVAEKNYGGEMVLSTLRNERSYGNADLVWSRRGKKLRAEPVVALYEQGRVHHMQKLETAETQMTTWVPETQDSPDRVDALVHAITELSGKGAETSMAGPGSDIDDAVSRLTVGPEARSLFGLDSYIPDSFDPYGGGLITPGDPEFLATLGY